MGRGIGGDWSGGLIGWRQEEGVGDGYKPAGIRPEEERGLSRRVETGLAGGQKLVSGE